MYIYLIYIYKAYPTPRWKRTRQTLDKAASRASPISAIESSAKTAVAPSPASANTRSSNYGVNSSGLRG